jgi:hypothetical protein
MANYDPACGNCHLCWLCHGQGTIKEINGILETVLHMMAVAD